MIDIHTGTFYNYKEHHPGWFRVFRFGKPVQIIEIWAGNKYLVINWR